MKSKNKIKTIILMILGIIFVLTAGVSNNLNITGNNNDTINLDIVNVKLFKVSGKIHIDNNWQS